LILRIALLARRTVRVCLFVVVVFAAFRTQAFGETLDQPFSTFLLPSADEWPGGIAVDRGGNVWVSEVMSNKIARLSPSGK
jgi:streptogramin lyase